RRAAISMAHLAGEPARIGGAAAQRPGDLLLERADFWRPGSGRIEMIEDGLRADALGRGGKPPLVLGERVGVERVLSRQVLRMDERLRARDALAESRRRRPPLAFAVVGITGRRQIGLGKLRPLRPAALRDPPSETDAVGAGRRAEYAGQR